MNYVARVARAPAIQLCGPTGDVVVDVATAAIVHWGATLGTSSLGAVLAAVARPVVLGAAAHVEPVRLVPEHGGGFPGRPGLAGHRPDGSDWAPRLAVVGHTATDDEVVIEAADQRAGLATTTTVHVGEVLRISVTLTNTGDQPYLLDRLSVSLPVPDRAAELVVPSGRWAREFALGRRAWSEGAHTAENRAGRTSHERPGLVIATTPGCGEWSGEAWAAHLAWSGNHLWLAERLPDGRRHLQIGELLHPGEITLAPGASYTTPEVVAAYSADGLTGISRAFHRHLRARPQHPTTPRPVLVNTWEAVYFDHGGDRLAELARRAARIGAERFVLDDGWFGSRRDDTSGLGDWVVSADAHPHGLGPLIALVHELGMEFGIWVEPEMLNPDSDLARAHPDWVLATDDEPVLSRHQLVLDLTRPDAFEHILGRLDALLGEHRIGCVKWDMNREHIAAAAADGRAATHDQTLAVYALLDELRRRHPGVEFESCAGGGGRIDIGILARTERVWTSDCNDALERQQIQRGASLLIPPELMGAHIGPERSHTTGRRHDLALRAATAMFGHLGIEQNLLDLDEQALDDLATVVALHRRFRPLLHGGDVVRFDTEPESVAHGVYAADRSEALVSYARVATAASLTPARWLLPGLDADTSYRVERLRLPGERPGPAFTEPAWCVEGVSLTGRRLATVGLQPPALHPETAIVVHLRTEAGPT